MDKTDIGKRMKAYEAIHKNFLMRRQPVIIRLDGKAFHGFTKGFDKPFDDELIVAMQRTMKYLCENIQGCVLGYTQSDEITLVLCDYQKYDTDAWFGYNVQKMVSISASMATFAFNREIKNAMIELSIKDYPAFVAKNDRVMSNLQKGALFDARCFTLSVVEVNNCLLWRQQDATRNSIQALAQSLYSHKKLEGINTKQLQDKMFEEKGVNWNDLPTVKKRGSCCIYVPQGGWQIDYNIPIFSQNPDYVNSRINFNND